VINTKIKSGSTMLEEAKKNLSFLINHKSEDQQRIERLENLIKSIEAELAKSTAQTSTESAAAAAEM
jgi:predicted  nucleic acid-binding Zn-ribbon protein